MRFIGHVCVGSVRSAHASVLALIAYLHNHHCNSPEKIDRPRQNVFTRTKRICTYVLYTIHMLCTSRTSVCHVPFRRTALTFDCSIKIVSNYRTKQIFPFARDAMMAVMDAPIAHSGLVEIIRVVIVPRRRCRAGAIDCFTSGVF